jgi:hypothetical protein
VILRLACSPSSLAILVFSAAYTISMTFSCYTNP